MCRQCSWRNYYYHHITDDEIGAERESDSSKFTISRITNRLFVRPTVFTESQTLLGILSSMPVFYMGVDYLEGNRDMEVKSYGTYLQVCACVGWEGVESGNHKN